MLIFQGWGCFGGGSTLDLGVAKRCKKRKHYIESPKNDVNRRGLPGDERTK